MQKRIMISISEETLKILDEAARKNKMTRSGYLTQLIHSNNISRVLYLTENNYRKLESMPNATDIINRLLDSFFTLLESGKIKLESK